MKFLIGVLVLAAIILLLTLACFGYVRCERKRRQRAERAMERGKNKEYMDERQIAEQGKAYEFTFVVALIYYMMAYFFLDYYRRHDLEPVLDPALVVLLGLFLMWIAHCLYCLMTDAVLPLRDNMAGTTVGFYIVGALRLTSAILSAADGEISLIGADSDAWFKLIEAIGLICVASIYLIANFRNKRASDEQ